MTWKKINQSDAGTSTKFGGNDLDKVSDAFSGTDVDDIDMNCDFSVRDNKLHYRNPANTFRYNVRTSAIVADRDVTEPLLTANDTRVYQAHTQTLTNKTVDIKSNSLMLRENTYLIFKDGSTYYARNNITGALTSNADFKTLLQAIIDTIGTRDDTVFTKIKIAPGEYDVESTITISNKYNISIEGSGMGITRIRAGASLGSSRLLAISGSVSGTGKNLTSNATTAQKTAVMSSGDAGTFSVADWVLLRSNKNFGTGGSASGHQGEIKQIASIASGTITFRESLFDTYNTADTANIIKLLPSREITLANFTIVPHPSYNPAGDGIWCDFTFVDRMLVDKVETIDYPGQFGGNLTFHSCTNVRVSDCMLQQNIAYNFQYGISFHSCCQDCVVTNCTAYGDWRHAFEAGSGELGTDADGVCRNIMFTGCTATGGSQNCFDSHPEGEGIHFINCSVLGTNDGGGIKLRSKNSSIVGCYIASTTQSASGQHAVMISDDASDCRIANCTIINCNSDGVKVKDGLDGTTIQGCSIRGNTGDGIHVDTGGANRTNVMDCTISSNSGDGIEMLDVDNGIITSNRISNNGGYGIRFEASTCGNNVIGNNSFSGNTSGAVLNGAQTGNKEANNFGY